MKIVYLFRFRLLAILAVLQLTMMGQVTFQKIYPTTYDKTARDVIATPDGGYLLTGYTNNSNMYDCDIYVIKTDGNGDTLWTKSYGGSKPDYSYTIIQASDGNYFIVGYSQSYSSGDMDVFLLKINPSGGLIFYKTYGGFGNDEGRDIIPTADGNYMITGHSDSQHSGNDDAFLMKIDISGTLLWTKYYGGANDEYSNSVKQCSDGGFVFTGQTMSYGQGGGDTWLVRTNPIGDTLWTKVWGGPRADEGKWVVINTDGSMAVVVRDSSYGAGDIDTRITKTDANGNIVWNKIYGGTQKDTPKRIITTSDGGYLVGAISRSFGWINPDMWILKLDAAGDTTWTRHYGGSDHEHCYSVKQSADGGYLACGHSRSYSPGQKVMFLKLNSNGQLGPVSVPELWADKMLSIYPNPSAGSIEVDLGGVVVNETSLKITNALGQEVYSTRVDASYSSPFHIDLSGHRPGVYFITFQCLTEGRASMRKIVLN